MCTSGLRERNLRTQGILIKIKPLTDTTHDANKFLKRKVDKKLNKKMFLFFPHLLFSWMDNNSNNNYNACINIMWDRMMIVRLLYFLFFFFILNKTLRRFSALLTIVHKFIFSNKWFSTRLMLARGILRVFFLYFIIFSRLTSISAYFHYNYIITIIRNHK